jgi:hypothetical protein
LKKDEAVLIIKEMLENCNKLEGVFLCMVPPTGSIPITSLGYQIHLKSPLILDSEITKCLEELSKKHNLSIQENKNEQMVVIYRKHK